MTDILLQVNNLPQDIKTHIYGFIHIEDRVKIMMEQYYDMLISNNSIWYQLVKHLDEEILEIFNNHSYDLYKKLGFPNVGVRAPSFILKTSFPKLNETIHFSRNKLQKTRHPFYDDIASFIRRGFKICVNKGRFNSRRYKSYKDYLIDNRVNIKKNFEKQYDLFTWKSYNNAFDKKYLEVMFNHLKTVLISIHRPSISRKLKNANLKVEILERLKAEKNEQNLELNRMQYEERLSRKYQKNMNVQTRRLGKLLKEQQVALLEQETIARREHRKAKRVAIELQRQEEKEAKRVAILKKKEEKESSRKLREKLARQREQDRMLASTTKLMHVMFTVKVVTKSKPKIDRTAQKAMKEKLKRQKDYDRADKEILKAMQAMFKITRKRSVKPSQKITNK